MSRTSRGAPEQQPPASQRTGAMRAARTPPSTRVWCRWLGLARASWIAAAILALGALVASIPGYGLVAGQGYWVERQIEAPAALAQALDLAGALASFSSAL